MIVLKGKEGTVNLIGPKSFIALREKITLFSQDEVILLSGYVVGANLLLCEVVWMHNAKRIYDPASSLLGLRACNMAKDRD